jgi:hypothetical protein
MLARVVERIQATLRRWFSVPSWDELEEALDTFRAEQEALAQQRLTQLDMRLRGRQDRLDEQERGINQRFAELDRVTSQTTLAVSDLLVAVELARKDWKEVLDAQQEKGPDDAA